MRKEIEQQILDSVYNFFISSNDFNGMPLRDVSRTFGIDYVESIKLVKDLVCSDSISIQSSTNPHIIHTQHYAIEEQLKVLDMAKDNKQLDMIEKAYSVVHALRIAFQSHPVAKSFEVSSYLDEAIIKIF